MRSALLSVKGMTKELWLPTLGRSVQIGESTIALTVNLGDTLMKSIRLSQFEDFQIAYLRSKFEASAESAIPVLTQASNVAEMNAKAEEEADQSAAEEKGDSGELDDAEDGEVKPQPDEPITQARKAILPTLFIGDLRLSSLKAQLATNQRMPADFAGEGVLVCRD